MRFRSASPVGLTGQLPWLLLWGMVSFAIAYVLQAEANSHRVCCDAVDYWRMAAAYDAGGLLVEHPSAGLRTWLYPAFLVLVSRLARLLSTEPAHVLFALQFGAYLASGALLARNAFPSRPRAASTLFALLACNPFASAYLGVALTDALALAVFNVWLAAMIGAHGRRGGQVGHGWFAAAATMAGVACALRPAYAWLPLVTLALALAMSGGVRDRVLRIVLAALLPCLALLPQVVINQHLFERPTPLPVAGLAGAQLRWGIENLKYATAPRPGSSALMFYANPLAAGTSGADAGVEWYARHPVRGVATLAAKLVGAFDFDFLHAYVWNREPRWAWLFRGASLALLVLGLQGMWRYARLGGGTSLVFGPRALPPLVFFAWATVTLATVVELRFTLPMLSLLLPMATWFVASEARAGSADRWRHAAVFAVAMLLAACVAKFVADQNVLL